MYITVPVKNPEIQDEEKTYLTAACAAAAASISVADYSGFDDNDYLVLGPYGKEKSEIVLIDDAGIDATISLDATDRPTYAHPANTKVSRMPWNQVEIRSSSTETGTFSVLATIDLEVDDEYTFYQDTTGDSDTWYKVRFKNVAAGNTYSGYSDAVQGAGYKANSRGRLKAIVLSLFGDRHGKWVDEDDLNNFFYQVESEVFDYRKKWSFLQTEGTFSLTAGVHKYALETQLTDIKSPTREYIENVWIHDNSPLDYKDRKDFDALLEGSKWTTLNGAIEAADTSITLTDGDKLEDSGTCYIEGEDIAYTDITTNTMTATAGEVDADHADDSEVWQSTELDEPAYFTIWGGDIFVNACPDDTYVASVNYYKHGTPMDEDNDVSEIPRSTDLLVKGVLALCYAAKPDEAMYKSKRAEFETALKEMNYDERLGQSQSLTPSDDEGLPRDWDKGSLREIKNAYRTT